MKTAVDLLGAELRELKATLAALVEESPVRYDRSMDNGGIVFVEPDYDWAPATAGLQRRQLLLKRRYSRWIERLRIVLSGAPDDSLERLKRGEESIELWLEKKSNWGLSPDAAVNRRNVESAFCEFEELLAILEEPLSGNVIVIPDTNALLACPQPERYGKLSGQKAFHFVLLPTVPSEIDELRYNYRAESVRRKAGALVRRIKGWRKQGRLTDGVVVHGTISVRAVAVEPDLANTLPWLDPSNKDDRILATMLEIQREALSSRLVLVTGDVNLQNKADVAGIPYDEPPAPAKRK